MMTDGPPFERYPGAPRRDDASFRVISPWRDALAWISIAGRLAVSSYLLRSDHGWTEYAPDGDEPEVSAAIWKLVVRDPVELTFRTISGPGIVASVTVNRAFCDIRLSPCIDRVAAARVVAIPESASVETRPNETTIHLAAKV